jgi:hypothetical protein
VDAVSKVGMVVPDTFDDLKATALAVFADGEVVIAGFD